MKTGLVTIRNAHRKNTIQLFIQWTLGQSPFAEKNTTALVTYRRAKKNTTLVTYCRTETTPPLSPFVFVTVAVTMYLTCTVIYRLVVSLIRDHRRYVSIGDITSYVSNGDEIGVDWNGERVGRQSRRAFYVHHSIVVSLLLLCTWEE